MRELWPLVKLVFKRWWNLMSCAVFTLFALYAALANKSNAWIAATISASALLFLCVGIVLAWRDDRRQQQNTIDQLRAEVRELSKTVNDRSLGDAPEVLLRWSSGDSQFGHDVVEVRNIGRTLAREIVFEDFSRPEFAWSRAIEIPALDPGAKRSVPAEFTRWVNQTQFELGRLRRILQGLAAGEEISVILRYANLEGTRFRRVFSLHLVTVGRFPEIECRPGKLEVLR